MRDMRPILRKKRDGEALTAQDAADFLQAYVAGEVPDYVAAALLATIFLRGMEAPELASWTEAMLHSGRTFRFPDDVPVVDKHSTGGVGDKASLPLAPALAVCGLRVPMISGRGLAHTGGTLDKLESIPGFRTTLDPKAFEAAVLEVGCAFGAQTEDLVPADRKLYALRNATGLIESIPLIASSILSKKLAEGLQALVLDVKFGSGAFLVDPDEGARLARTMIQLAERLDVSTVAFQTAMDRPLGRAFGNALEVRESLDCLRGEGPADLRELVCALGGSLLNQVGFESEVDAARARIARTLDDGSALERFEATVRMQGGDPRAVADPDRLPTASQRTVWKAPHEGWLTYRDVRELGLATVALGGGRRHLDDTLDPAVGLVALQAPGAKVASGEPLFELHHNGKGLAEAERALERAIAIASAAPPPPTPLILQRHVA